MKTKSQKQAIVYLMLQGKKLDWISAFKLTGCSKLATRISELKKQGFRIQHKQINFKSKYGNHGYYFEYWINKKDIDFTKKFCSVINFL